MSDETLKANIVLRGIESEPEIYTLTRGVDPHILITPGADDEDVDFNLDSTGLGVDEAIVVLTTMVAFLKEMEVTE